MKTSDLTWILVTLIIIALVSIIILSCNYHSKYEKHQSSLGSELDCPDDGPNQPDQVENILEEFALPIGILVFGGGSIMLRVYYLLADIQCLMFNPPSANLSHVFLFMSEEDHHSNPEYTLSGMVSRIAKNLAILVFFLVQIPFLTQLHSLRYIREKYYLHHVILLIACADVSVWLYVFFKESHLVDLDLIHYGETQLSETETIKTACANFSSAIDIYCTETLEHILFPFTMEFMLASLEVLLHVWLLSRRPFPSTLNNIDDPSQPLLPASGDVNVVTRQLTTQYPATQTGHSADQVSTSQANHLQLNRDQHTRQRTASTGGTLPDTIPEEDLDHSEVLSEDQGSVCIVNAVRGDFRSRNENNVITRWWHKMYSVVLTVKCNLYTGLVSGILEMVLLNFYILNYRAMRPEEKHFQYNLPQDSVEFEKEHSYMTEEEFDRTVNLPVVSFRIVFIFIPSIWASVHCAIVLSTSRIIRPGESRLTGNYVTLALACAGVLIITGFETAVCITKMKNSGPKFVYFLSITEALMTSVQFIAQALLIYFGQRRLPCRAHRFYESLQGSLSYLVMFNFMQWIIDSFLEIQFLTLRNELKAHKGSESDPWHICVHLFVPPCIYFRYMSTLLLLRVKRLVREKEQPLLRVQQGRAVGLVPVVVNGDDDDMAPRFSLSTNYGTIRN